MLPKLLTLCLFITLIQAQKDKSNKDNNEEQCTNLKTFTDSSSNTNTNSESNEKPNVKASKQFTKQSTASKSVPLRPNIILTDVVTHFDLFPYYSKVPQTKDTKTGKVKRLPVSTTLY